MRGGGMILQTAHQSATVDEDTGRVFFVFLRLMDVVVARARSDARSKNDNTRFQAIAWLNEMRLPVDGPTRQCRLENKKWGKGAQ